jgi:ATP-dependent protease HslVU (ClpYQ) ATPase subunit
VFCERERPKPLHNPETRLRIHQLREAPELHEKTIPITGDHLRQRLAEAVKDEDFSKFIL